MDISNEILHRLLYDYYAFSKYSICESNKLKVIKFQKKCNTLVLTFT